MPPSWSANKPLPHSLHDTMKPSARLVLLLAPLLLVACHKKQPEAAAAAPAPVVVAAAPAPAAAPAAAPAELTDEQREKAEKQALLDYSNMEEKYLTDPKAQWAASATASSVYGDPKPAESSVAVNAVGPINDKNWTNNNLELGFDWIELGYAKPVSATEVRLVLGGGDGVESLTKVELQSTDGKWNTVWSGISDVKKDRRGARTWFVRSFEKTAYKVKAVKYTIANNMEHVYKNVEAAQLVGE